MKCPVCKIEMSKELVCPQCKREWEVTGFPDAMLTSKPRRMWLVKPIQVGECLDDCLKLIGKEQSDKTKQTDFVSGGAADDGTPIVVEQAEKK